MALPHLADAVENVVETVEAYWAAHLGCSIDQFHAGSSCVVRHAPALADYRGIVLSCGLVPQYRTLESNSPSMAVAAALGFVPLATTVAVRLS